MVRCQMRRNDGIVSDTFGLAVGISDVGTIDDNERRERYDVFHFHPFSKPVICNAAAKKIIIVLIRCQIRLSRGRWSRYGGTSVDGMLR